MLGQISGKVQNLINSGDRPAGHVVEGALICAGALLLAALAASRRPARPVAPNGPFGVLWRPAALVLALSGLRIWNAPESRERTRALELWTAVQALGVAARLINPRRRSAQFVTAAAALGAGVGYATAAKQVDSNAAAMVSPYLGWTNVAGLLAHRASAPVETPTIH